MLTIKARINRMKIFQPEEFQCHMCSCTYEIQPDEFNSISWKINLHVVDIMLENYTQKKFHLVEKTQLDEIHLIDSTKISAQSYEHGMPFG